MFEGNKYVKKVSVSLAWFIVMPILALSTLSLTTILQPHKAYATSFPAYRYTKTFDASSDSFSYAAATATDNQGNVYLTGWFSGTINFAGTGGSDSVTSANTSSFLTKYNADGTYGWTKTFDTSASATNAESTGVSTDSNGNVYMTGSFDGTVIFDGPGGSDSVTTANTTGYLTKYNANGTYGWTKTFDTSASGAQAYSHRVATDSSGNIYSTGDFSGTVVFDGTGGSDSVTSVSNSGYLTKYNANGTYGWTKTFDTSASGAFASSVGVSSDSSGNIYTTGIFRGTVIFDGPGGSDSQTAAGGNQDTFLTKYNANGTYGWTKTFDTSASGAQAGSANFGGITTDSQGDVYQTGWFSGTVVFDGVGGSDSQTAAGGNQDTFLTKYNANGSYGYTKTFDVSASGASSYGSDITTDSIGDVYLLSGFSGTVVFDGVGGSDSQTSSNNDGAITKYNPDGTYAWTKSFDTTNGYAVLGEGPLGGITSDNSGNIYVASFFGGTVTFDGSGGSDTQTTAAGSAGFLTSYQAFTPSTPNVSTVSDPINGQSVTLTTPSACTNQSATISDASSNAVKDSYTYPAGLLSFTTDCHTPGYTAAITIDFYGLTNKNLVLRKYNPNTKMYADVPGATVTNTTINGQPVVEATYSITDGGPLDQDGAANGIIVDPVGLAVAPAAPNTGFGVYLSSPLRILLTFSSLAVLLASVGILARRLYR